MTTVRKAVAIRNKFTDKKQKKNFSRYDYAVITQQMKRWLHLGDQNKWLNQWRLIAVAELRSLQIMRKVHLNNRLVAKAICFAVCKTI